MHALIGRVALKPGREDEALDMISSRGVPMVTGLAGSKGGYWARSRNGDGQVVQHLFWLFDSEADTRAAQTMALTLRGIHDAPATFISAEVCEIVGIAPAPS